MWLRGQVITYVNLQALSHGVVVQNATCPDDLAHKVWGIQQGTPRLIQASETGLQEAKGAFHHSMGTCVCFIVSSLSWGLGVPEWGHEMGPSTYAESPGREKTGGC